MLQMLIVTKKQTENSPRLQPGDARVHVLGLSWAYQYQGMLSPLLSFYLDFHALHNSVMQQWKQFRYWHAIGTMQLLFQQLSIGTVQQLSTKDLAVVELELEFRACQPCN